VSAAGPALLPVATSLREAVDVAVAESDHSRSLKCGFYLQCRQPSGPELTPSQRTIATIAGMSRSGECGRVRQWASRDVRALALSGPCELERAMGSR